MPTLAWRCACGAENDTATTDAKRATFTACVGCSRAHCVTLAGAFELQEPAARVGVAEDRDLALAASARVLAARTVYDQETVKKAARAAAGSTAPEADDIIDLPEQLSGDETHFENVEAWQNDASIERGDVKRVVAKREDSCAWDYSWSAWLVELEDKVRWRYAVIFSGEHGTCNYCGSWTGQVVVFHVEGEARAALESVTASGVVEAGDFSERIDG